MADLGSSKFFLIENVNFLLRICIFFLVLFVVMRVSFFFPYQVIFMIVSHRYDRKTRLTGFSSRLC